MLTVVLVFPVYYALKWQLYALPWFPFCHFHKLFCAAENSVRATNRLQLTYAHVSFVDPFHVERSLWHKFWTDSELKPRQPLANCILQPKYIAKTFHFYRILKTNFWTFLLLSLKSVILIRFNSDFPIFLALKRSEKVAQRSVCYWTAATSMCILIISALSLFLFSAEQNEKSVIALSSKRGNTLLCSTKAGCIWWRTAFNNVALGCAEQWK